MEYVQVSHSSRKPPGYTVACLLSAVGTAAWNLMPVALGAAADALRLTSAQTGVAGASLLAGWLAATGVAIFGLHRWSRRGAVSTASLLAAIGLAAAARAHSAAVLDVCLFLGGFGAALIYCVAIELIAELADTERAFGAKVGSEVLSGAAFLYGFSALLVPAGGFGAVAIGMAVVYLAPIFLVPFLDKQAHPPRDRLASEAGMSLSMGILVVGALLLFMTGITGLWAFLERIGVGAGVGPKSLGWILAAQKLVGGIAALITVIAGSRFGLRWPHVFGAICITAAALMLAQPSGIANFALATWVWELGFALSFAYQAAMISRLDPSNRLLLLIPACIGLSGVIGPAIAGLLVRGVDYSGALAFAIGCSIVAAGVFVAACVKLARSQAGIRVGSIQPSA
jgi:MFS transporter, DHA1 family, inner membrane transport protein